MRCLTWVRLRPLSSSLLLLVLVLAGCGSTDPAQYDPKLQMLEARVSDPLAHYTLTGDVGPLRDPSMMRVGNTYYLFGTDVGSTLDGGHIPIRCSSDTINWKACGYVFSNRPLWVRNEYAGISDLWCPDISYFGGLYHLYYAASIFTTNQSGIGLATNTTLDPNDPNYQWVDRGEILSSRGNTSGLNAIDPNISADDDGRIWLNYGSWVAGIFQQEVDPVTGYLVEGGPVYHLAERPDFPSGPIEGASIIHHGKYFYLFASADICCEPNPADSDYKQVMGRSTSVHGPFVSMRGDPMLKGYSTILLSKDGAWLSAGGGSAYIDPQTSDTMIAFHAFNMHDNGTVQLWVKHFTWENDWPILR